MDQRAYDERSNQFRRQLREVEDAIFDFTVEDVFEQNVDDCDQPLSQIKEKFVAFRNNLREFYTEFDTAAHPDWEEEWEDKLQEVGTKYKQNDREIRTKIQTLKAQTRNVAAQARTATDKTKEETVLVARAEIERMDILRCLTELLFKIKKSGEIAKMEDFEVIKFLRDSSKWNDDMKALDKRYIDLQKLVVLNPFEEGTKVELETLHGSVKADLRFVAENLEKEDASRKLYTNSKSQSKDSVPYPVFRSKDDEDIHKFLKEFKEALIRNQIPVKDQVKILRNNLKNFALEIVHKDVTAVDEAYKLLIKHFGNSDQIWSAKFKILLNECEKRWPSLDQNPKERFQKISKLVTQLEELESLVTGGDVEKAEMYNATSVKKLFSIIPDEITNEAFEKIDDKSSNEDKVNKLKAVMIKYKNAAQQKMLMNIDTKEDPVREKFNYGEQKNQCFFCKEDWNPDTHIKEWGIFGCCELLKLSSDERREILIKKRLCLSCGYSRVSKTSRDPKSHRCKNLFTELRCEADHNGAQCKFNGLTCRHKKVNPSVKSKVKSKLRLDLSGFNLAIINENIAVTSIAEPAAIQVNVNEGKYETRINDLQMGEIAKNMDNKEIHEFFKDRESLVGGDVDKILGIPEGETLFIFCIIKGRTRSLRSFMDCGCSSWLVKNGVPENELKSVKLRDGPIPMFVAGGHTVHASAEWASLLPLSNGHNQIIRGLSVDNVTGPFAEIDMTPILDELKESVMNSSSPHKKMVARLKAPTEVSGQTDMLLGMKHWNLFPEPIHSTPEGLTLFKNKFLSSGEGEITCIGGPSKALAQMMNQFGAAQVMNMFTKISEHPKSFSRNLEYFPAPGKDELTAMKLAALDGNIEEDIFVGLLKETFPEDSFEEQLSANETTDEVLHANGVHAIASSEDVIGVAECVCCFNVFLPTVDTIASMQNDLKKFLDLQDLGLKMEYRCPSCRDCINCKRGEHYEKVSIRQEAEQCLIRESIWIDQQIGRAVAKLPFRVDPDKVLTNNRGVSIKMLDRVCMKYYHDKEVVELIVKAFKKLYDNGHIKFWKDLTETEKNILKRAPVSYFIPWDINFSGSISTPARPTFNASKNTPRGTNLNDTIVKGIPNFVSLLHMSLGWVSGPEAISGDISQFFNAVLLHLDHLPYQRFVFRDGLNPEAKLLEGVICTLIYGVRSVSAQTDCREANQGISYCCKLPPQISVCR